MFKLVVNNKIKLLYKKTYQKATKYFILTRIRTHHGAKRQQSFEPVFKPQTLINIDELLQFLTCLKNFISKIIF